MLSVIGSDARPDKHWTALPCIAGVRHVSAMSHLGSASLQPSANDSNRQAAAHHAVLSPVRT